MLNIVLLEPEIPQNVGNIARTCVVAGLTLHLIKPLGFQLTEKKLRRAGMDYWDQLKLHTYDSFEEFKNRTNAGPIWMATTKAQKIYTEAPFKPGCYIMFGKESAGIPETLLLDHKDYAIRIPMGSQFRSLNLASSVSIVAYEALRQNGFSGLEAKGQLHCNDWGQ